MKILVLCTGNSCRSQMAHGILKTLLPQSTVFSAGTHPESVNTIAISVMKDIGIDISNHSSNHIDEYLSTDLDYVITVCDNAKESCPVFPREVTTIHHSFEDPAKVTGTDNEQRVEYARIRDEIRFFCNEFVKNIHD